MKLKSLLFGSAAVLAAGTGAQAADLPTVEPVEYVRICDAFGTGYYYIPGTDTCLKVGGYVRAESHYVNGDDVGIFYGTRSNGLQIATISDSIVNNWTTRVRGQINLDARTQTDFGLVRAYIAIEMQVGHDNVTEGDNPTTATTVEGTPNYPGTASNLAAAFIQISNNWGTYTAGRTGSFFDFWGSHGYGTRLNIDDSTTDTNLFAWTFAGGNGFSFTVAAEDPASNGRRRNGDDDYEGQEAPDGVANIRVDQGWGSAQIMGAVRHINDVNGDGLGFAVGAGVGIGIPGGWRIDAQGGYSEGAVAYITTDPGAIGDFNGNDGDDTNEAWSVRAGITGPLFNPNLEVWLDGSYTEAEEDDNGDDYEFWAVKAGARWSPVAGLGIGPEFAYLDFDGDDAGEDFDVWGVMWRIQRSF
jgi:hypothetical protein